MRQMLTLLAALALAACAGATPIAKPADGYEAIRVKETVVLPFGRGLMLPAGRVYVADRLSNRTGKLLWCSDDDYFGCMDWSEGNATFQPDNVFSIGPFPIPPGAVEEFRLR